jgi:hypothetical protein
MDSVTESYDWSVSANLSALSYYGFKLALDSDESAFQYSPYFSISGLEASAAVSSSSSSTSTAILTSAVSFASPSPSSSSISSTLTPSAPVPKPESVLAQPPTVSSSSLS